MSAILIRDCILLFTCIAPMGSDVGHLNQRLFLLFTVAPMGTDVGHLNQRLYYVVYM